MTKAGLESIEEPLKDNSPENVISIQEQTGIPVIVDEGLCSYNDGLNLVNKGFKGIFNIRLSKCGGVAQALKLIHLASEHGIRCQLGCQVGESAILSALGRHFAVVHPSLLYLEGSYGTHILKEDISAEDIRFSYRGRGVPLEKEGLGISVIESRIEEFGEKVLSRTLM
jgi:muconate cycloisomerase